MANIVNPIILMVAGDSENRLNLLLKNELTELTAEDFAGVTEISNYNFYNRSNLQTVNLPSNLTSIGSFAFMNCTGLTGNLIVPESAYLNSDVFRNTGLSKIKLGGSGTVTTPARACSSSVNLNSIEIGEGTTKVYNQLAYDVPSIDNVILSSTVAELSSSWQNVRIPKLVVKNTTPPTAGANINAEEVYVPIGSISSYQSNTKWTTSVGAYYPIVTNLDTASGYSKCIIFDAAGNCTHYINQGGTWVSQGIINIPR